MLPILLAQTLASGQTCSPGGEYTITQEIVSDAAQGQMGTT